MVSLSNSFIVDLLKIQPSLAHMVKTIYSDLVFCFTLAHLVKTIYSDLVLCFTLALI
jgi:hypothetical protein